jgi:hypothetical protein
MHQHVGDVGTDDGRPGDVGGSLDREVGVKRQALSTRNAILDAAAECFVGSGCARTTMKDTLALAILLGDDRDGHVHGARAVGQPAHRGRQTQCHQLADVGIPACAAAVLATASNRTWSVATAAHLGNLYDHARGGHSLAVPSAEHGDW